MTLTSGEKVRCAAGNHIHNNYSQCQLIDTNIKGFANFTILYQQSSTSLCNKNQNSERAALKRLREHPNLYICRTSDKEKNVLCD